MNLMNQREVPARRRYRIQTPKKRGGDWLGGIEGGNTWTISAGCLESVAWWTLCCYLGTNYIILGLFIRLVLTLCFVFDYSSIR
jgi:hypothetical protein